MRSFVAALVAFLFAACAASSDGSTSVRQPATTTTSDPTPVTTEAVSRGCLDAYKQHRATQSARSAQRVLTRCGSEIDAEFQAGLRTFVADTPSPGCRSAYREWMTHRDAEPRDRTWTSNRHYAQAAAEALQVCDFEIDADLQDMLRAAASRPYLSDECLTAYREWDAVLVERTDSKAWYEEINIVDRTIAACSGQLEESLWTKIVESKPYRAATIRRATPVPGTTMPRVSGERACDLLWADYFEAVADGNTDRQLRLNARILREDC